MGLFDKIDMGRLSFGIPQFDFGYMKDVITSSSKEKLKTVSSCHQQLRLGYYAAKWFKKEFDFDRSFSVPMGGTFFKKFRDEIGAGKIPMASNKLTLAVGRGHFAVVDKAYEEITGKPPARKFPVSAQSIKKLDSWMSRHPVDIDKDGTCEICTSVLRIDMDDKPESFYLHYQKPATRVIYESVTKKFRLPVGFAFDVSLEIYITPSDSPSSTIHISLPVSTTFKVKIS